ncbi:MAG: site-specific DNA-methyltransferase, partial [Chloroflexi bacterium]|nr:site-specific DNA-methyltransferase [Chloroflexota bacterium]
MAVRLRAMRRALKETGSIYLHCDPTASHYLKLLMDAIYGPKMFRNEIIWAYPPGGKGPNFAFHRKHDVILYFSIGSKPTFNRQFTPLSDYAISKFTKVDEDGRKYKEYRNTTRTYLEDVPGRPVPSVWVDIHSLGQTISSERLGYPTQKPLALLERIIRASSNEGDTVLDPFCGCGTTVHAAESLGRRWLGIDISKFSAGLI